MALRFPYALIVAAALVAAAPTPVSAADEPVASAAIPPPLPSAPRFPSNTPSLPPKTTAAKPAAVSVGKSATAVSHSRHIRHLASHRPTHHANHHVVVQKETPQPQVRLRYYAAGPTPWYARPPAAGYYVTPYWRGAYAW
jgi:hypothetical protein